MKCGTSNPLLIWIVNCILCNYITWNLNIEIFCTHELTFSKTSLPAYDSAHWEQLNLGLTFPSWIMEMWSFSTAAVFNILPHIGQILPTLFPCTVEICVFKPVSNWNQELQSEQSYNFTPLCFLAIFKKKIHCLVCFLR